MNVDEPTLNNYKECPYKQTHSTSRPSVNNKILFVFVARCPLMFMGLFHAVFDVAMHSTIMVPNFLLVLDKNLIYWKKDRKKKLK